MRVAITVTSIRQTPDGGILLSADVGFTVGRVWRTDITLPPETLSEVMGALVAGVPGPDDI